MLEALPFAALSFAITFLATPKVMRWAKRAGFTGVDLHKEAMPEIPEQGGIAVIMGFLTSALLYALLTDASPRFYATLVAVLLVAALGYYDRIRRLSAKEKVVYLSLIGVILLPFVGDTRLFGVELGFLYLLAVPLAFMCACNFTNMLAGFNGLEIGTGAIASLGVAVVALLQGKEESFVIAMLLFASLIAFLHYNRYPARVFPGDVATLAIGAALLPALIFGKLEVEGAVIFLPYVADALLKFISAGVMTREAQKPTLVRQGLLYAPEGGNLSLPRLFLKLKPMREPQVVALVWAVELACVAVAIVLALR
jgi:UDP-N-acetylglucosamine--dolichyl-phosphate N-acetylglucosaminephosphotransferase